MSPLDQRKQVPNLKEDGEGSVQVKMTQNEDRQCKSFCGLR